MSEINQDVNMNDDAELDRMIEADQNRVRAGETIGTKNPDGSVSPTGQSEVPAPTGPTGEESPTGPTGPSEEAPGAPQATGETGEDDIRIPNKGKWESDEAYEKRIELFDLVKKRRAATTPEAKEALSADIRRAKGELKTLNGAERFIQPRTEAVPTGATGPSGEIDPNFVADQERLKALGGATREEVAEILRQERYEGQVRSDVESFVEKHGELKDEDVREVFFDFVEQNYAWEGKSGKALSTVLEMAYENMFRPSESVQDRVLKAAGVQDKVNAMQFPGVTGGKTTYSPEMQQSIDELKATGMSEDKALELLSE